jgi:MFS family permease
MREVNTENRNAALLFALPYGILADKRGRRLVIGLGLLGQMLCDSYILLILYFFNIFPTRAVLAASVFRCIGGGNAILLATGHAIIADASPSKMR